MEKFDVSPLAPYPRFAGASRAVLAVMLVALYAAVLASAGPGNGYEAPRAALTLPRVVVVAKREAAPQAVVASAAVNQVNLHKQ